MSGGSACLDEDCRIGTPSRKDGGFGAAQLEPCTSGKCDGGNTFPSESIFDRESATNPFATATYVFISNCSGDYYVGDNDHAFPSWTAHFHGWRNQALFSAWVAAALPTTSRVVLTGGSAGAVGAMLNYWRWVKGVSTRAPMLVAFRSTSAGSKRNGAQDRDVVPSAVVSGREPGHRSGRGWWAICRERIVSAMSTTPRSLAMVLVHLAALTACSSDGNEPVRLTTIAAIDPTLSLTVESKVGKVVKKEIAVSGRDRLDVPDTRHWTCGSPLRGTVASNVAWFELANPSTHTLSVTVKLDGLEQTHPKLFVYASKSTPLRDCLTFSGERSLAGTSSIVVEPSSYAAVLVATGAATGVYGLVMETEHVIAP